MKTLFGFAVMSSAVAASMCGCTQKGESDPAGRKAGVTPVPSANAPVAKSTQVDLEQFRPAETPKILAAIKKVDELAISYGEYRYYSTPHQRESLIVAQTDQGSMFRISRFGLLKRDRNGQWTVIDVSHCHQLH